MGVVGYTVGGVLFWPITAAADVLHAWRDWVPTVPEEVTSVGRVIHSLRVCLRSGHRA